jgi:F420H(2)-dependent quinone reductase
MIDTFGASHLGVWVIKHVVSPIHHWAYRLTGGRAFRWGRLNRSILLLTTTGRRSGRPRTTPVFFLRDKGRFVVCNVNPGAEHSSPWVLNLRSNPVADLQVGREIRRCRAREVHDAEIEDYWPRLIALWPAYREHYERSADRSVFVLEPLHGRSD